ncbi:MAG: Crp/Fnr family transcriptional regulator [Ruminiclostridium sp.]|nr:Crp/Fnr family transcriptional regulator [Ruminiclostridium sp.]
MLTHPQIEHCPLFRDLSTEDRAYALTYFDSKTRTYEKGDFLHQVSFPLQRFGLVLSGSVQVYMDDIDGHHIIMAHVEPGGLFGESYAFLGIDAPIYICAVSEAEILWMSPHRIKAPVSPVSQLDQELSNRFVACLASRTLQMNQRIQILSRNTLRTKLITFLSQYATEKGDSFTIPFDRASMAAYLGSDRSALSRELSRMQAEGILTYHRNHFRILK